MGNNVTAGATAAAALAFLGNAYLSALAPTVSPPAFAQVKPPNPAAPAPVDIVVGSDGWLFPGWDYLVDERPGQTRAALEQAVTLSTQARQYSPRVVLLLIPNKARFHIDRLPPDRAAWTRHHSGGLQKLADDLRQRGLEVIVAEPTFYPRDAHWTAEAGEAAASKVAEHLAALRRPKGPALPVPGWVQERRYADLANLARSRGDLRWEQDVFRRRDYVAPLPGIPQVEIVGNSLIDTYYGFPQEISRQLGVPVVHRVRYEGAGPWHAMQEFLKAGVKRPAVIWALQETSFSAFGPASLQP